MYSSISGGKKNYFIFSTKLDQSENFLTRKNFIFLEGINLMVKLGNRRGKKKLFFKQNLISQSINTKKFLLNELRIEKLWKFNGYGKLDKFIFLENFLS
jgi:hypothetical protein